MAGTNAFIYSRRIAARIQISDHSITSTTGHWSLLHKNRKIIIFCWITFSVKKCDKDRTNRITESFMVRLI